MIKPSIIPVTRNTPEEPPTIAGLMATPESRSSTIAAAADANTESSPPAKTPAVRKEPLDNIRYGSHPAQTPINAIFMAFAPSASKPPSWNSSDWRIRIAVKIIVAP